MSILDFIKNLFKSNKKVARLITQDLTKVKGESEPLEVGLYENKTPLVDKYVSININGVIYERKTDSNGIARLNINLPVGEYDPHITFEDSEYEYTSTYCKVTINPMLITQDLTMVEKDGNKFNAYVQSDKGDKLSNIKVTFSINGKNYERTSDENGVASLNINLKAGDYEIKTSCVGVTRENTIHISNQPPKKTRMEGTDINMTYRDGTQYQCAVYDDNGRVAGTVNLTINGRTYSRTPDNEGLYKLNLNLAPGNYTLNANYIGDNTHLPSSITNNITINEPKPEPTQLWDYFTQQGGGYLGQKTGYTCGPHSLMQCIHRLTGEDVSEMTLASVCGCTTDGTDHEGLATGLAWFNREYGYNLKMEWKNFSEVGFEGTQQLIDNGACFHHIYYRLYAGHYEVPKWTGGDPIYVLNSLGDNCGDGYCGYIEERSRSTHQAYINGINQKSVCIITR